MIFIVVFFFIDLNVVEAGNIEPMILDEFTERLDVYSSLEIIKGEGEQISIDDIMANNLPKDFVPSKEIKQKIGFFERENWLRFEISNQSKQSEWLLEFAFPIIHELRLYVQDGDKAVSLYQTGSDLPFKQREIEHRHFIFDIEIPPSESRTFYALAVGSGDLHPPINLWDKGSFIEKTQREFVLLGIFYGVIIVMILYNLFLFISLRLKSYLYYVLVILFTLLGKVSINGLGFQYLWPNAPAWNVMAAPFWVALSFIFIIIFTKHFLDVNRYIPSFKRVSYIFIILNISIIVTLPMHYYLAHYLMVFSSISTFLFVLIVAIICLVRGGRQARFYIAGWLIFAIGVSITILERAVILPYSIMTEYAGQIALSIEVVLLSFALADKINIMRNEKMIAEKKVLEHQSLALKSLGKVDDLKDEFLATISQELRTPLYGMIGIAESLQAGITGTVTAEMKNQLSMIISSGKKLTHLVNEVLDFSKIKYQSLELNMTTVKLSSIVDIIVIISSPLLRNKQIRLINKVDDGLPTIQADRHRLQQILLNLIDNAIKYTEEGQIIISSFVEDEQLIIEVSDTGDGIPSDQLEMIFKPFRQADHSLSREVSGIGLGLNIAKDLVELHGGKLSAISKVGEGSVFRVTLPFHEMTKTIEEPFNPSRETFYGNHKLQHFSNYTGENKANILVADDEVVNVQVLMNQLSLQGYRVFVAKKGEEVFKIIEKNEVDLLILDMMVPGMSGYEVSKQLRRTYSLIDLPILMLTAKNHLNDKMLSFEVGANDYLVKPCDREELISRVKTLVHLKKLNQELVNVNLHLEEKVSERTYKLKQVNNDLQETVESRRQLLANIAHELGTPVTLLHHYIQSVQKGLISPGDLRYQQFVKDKINLLNRLIDDLFDLSKLESGKINLNLVGVCLSDWLEQVCNRYEFTVIQEKRQFKQKLNLSEFKHFTCYFDQERMDQVFSNLISNAINNTAKNLGEIVIDAKLLGTDRIMIEVSDNGIGISKEDLPFIFNRFYRKNGATKKQIGTGLGLAIVNQIVQGHKGEIRVESELNIGTIFYLTFPIISNLKKEGKEEFELMK